MEVDLPEGVTVILVNKYNKKHEIRRKEGVKTKNGRIPLRDICKEWNLSNVIWVDAETPVKFDPKNGLSDLSFAFMDTVYLKGDISLINQERLAKEFMDKDAKKKPLVPIKENTKGIDIVMETEEKVLHPNVQRKNALESLVKKTSTGTTGTAKTGTGTTTTGTVNNTTTTKVIVQPTSSGVTSSPTTTKKAAVVNIKKDTNVVEEQQKQEDVYSQVEKLASLRDKGILSEEEFQTKKKQLLGL
ncbi:hypothetical protein ABK040_000228 [Willaertia magna]